MNENTNSEKDKCREEVVLKKGSSGSGLAGAVYGLGFIGAAIFYIANASTFWTGVLGFLKAIVWPTFVVMNLLEFLY